MNLESSEVQARMNAFHKSLLDKLPAAITVTPIYGSEESDGGGDRQEPEMDEGIFDSSDMDFEQASLDCSPSAPSVSSLGYNSFSDLTSDNDLSAYSICAFCDKLIVTTELLTHNCTVAEEDFQEAEESESVEECENYIEESRRSVGIYSCHECPLVFTSSLHLDLHLQSHGKNPDGTYRCSECQKTFKTFLVLEKHVRIHNGTAPYPCTVCPKTFNQPVHLKAHMRRHEGITPYKCALCPKAYADTTSLNYHMNSHSGKRPYNCPHCPRGFSKKGAWQTHVNSHADKIPTTAPTTAAASCSQAESKDSCDLPFRCSFCKKSFRTSSAVKNHERSHQKKFNCPSCSQGFATALLLLAHQRSAHPGSSAQDQRSLPFKPSDLKFVCAKCSEKFPDIATLNHHKVTTHSN